MLKLIACDIDGTLIPYGESRLPDGLFPLIRRLGQAGIRFCPASGRQYHSLRQLFAPVAGEVCFLAENGAILYGPGPEETAPVLGRTPMPREEALALSQTILELPGCQLLVSGANTSYLCCPEPGYVEYLLEDKGNKVTILEDMAQMPEDFLKVSAYCPGGTDAPQEALGERWGHLGMAAAGPDWVDFTLADKGTGLRGLCEALSVAPEETAAFGDNWNDVPMLSLAGQPWLMSTAHPDLRAMFPRQCGNVLEVLEDMLKK